jgi:hypothetical protein
MKTCAHREPYEIFIGATVCVKAAEKNETHILWPMHTSASLTAFEIIKQKRTREAHLLTSEI